MVEEGGADRPLPPGQKLAAGGIPFAPRGADLHQWRAGPKDGRRSPGGQGPSGAVTRAPCPCPVPPMCVPALRPPSWTNVFPAMYDSYGSRARSALVGQELRNIFRPRCRSTRQCPRKSPTTPPSFFSPLRGVPLPSKNLLPHPQTGRVVRSEDYCRPLQIVLQKAEPSREKQNTSPPPPLFFIYPNTLPPHPHCRFSLVRTFTGVARGGRSLPLFAAPYA